MDTSIEFAGGDKSNIRTLPLTHDQVRERFESGGVPLDFFRFPDVVSKSGKRSKGHGKEKSLKGRVNDSVKNDLNKLVVELAKRKRELGAKIKTFGTLDVFKIAQCGSELKEIVAFLKAVDFQEEAIQTYAHEHKVTVPERSKGLVHVVKRVFKKKSREEYIENFKKTFNVLLGRYYYHAQEELEDAFEEYSKDNNEEVKGKVIELGQQIYLVSKSLLEEIPSPTLNSLEEIQKLLEVDFDKK